MNHVIVKYMDMNSKAEISINGEKISTYSDMTALINQPFHEIADRIIKGLDQEIFDEYEVELLGTEYQYEVLQYHQKKSIYCKSITYTKPQMSDVQRWFYTYIFGLAQKYQLQTEPSEKVKIYSLAEEVLAAIDKEYSISGREEADVEVVKDLGGVEIENLPVECFILLKDEYDFRVIKGKKVFGLPLKSLPSFLNYYEKYCMQMPKIETVINSLKYMKLEPEDLTGFQAAVEGKEDFYLGELPAHLDVGEEVKVQFESFPIGAFTFRVKEEGTVAYQNKVIRAKEKGVGIIEIANSQNEVVCTREIVVIQHNYVKEIRVLSTISYMHTNERSKIEIVAIPGNAEDANSLKWEMEDYSIAHVNEIGEVIALTEGKTKLRISGVEAVKEVMIEVKPVVKELRFKYPGVRIKQGESAIVECEVIPHGAPFENLKWSFDNEVIASIAPSYDKKKCKIQAKKEHSGRGNLKCVDQKQNVSAVCNVEIVRLKTAGTLAGCTMAALGVGFCCMPFMIPIATILSIVGLNSTERAEDKKTFKVCLIISIIQIIGWAILLIFAMIESQA